MHTYVYVFVTQLLLKSNGLSASRSGKVWNILKVGVVGISLENVWAFRQRGLLFLDFWGFIIAAISLSLSSIFKFPRWLKQCIFIIHLIWIFFSVTITIWVTKIRRQDTWFSETSSIKYSYVSRRILKWIELASRYHFQITTQISLFYSLSITKLKIHAERFSMNEYG